MYCEKKDLLDRSVRLATYNEFCQKLRNAFIEPNKSQYLFITSSNVNSILVDRYFYLQIKEHEKGIYKVATCKYYVYVSENNSFVKNEKKMFVSGYICREAKIAVRYHHDEEQALVEKLKAFADLYYDESHLATFSQSRLAKVLDDNFIKYTIHVCE